MNLEPCSRDHREDKVYMQSIHNSGFNIQETKIKIYTLLFLGGRQPLCGSGVTSIISVTSIPAP